MRSRALALLGLVVAVLFCTAAPAAAHPLGNFSVNTADRVVVVDDGIEVTHVVDLAELPTVQLRGEFDRDRDGALGPAELTAYAWALHRAGRHREALQHANRGLRLHTRDARSYYYRGTIRQALGDKAGARADLTRALTLNPHFSLRYSPDARATLARLKGTR